MKPVEASRGLWKPMDPNGSRWKPLGPMHQAAGRVERHAPKLCEQSGAAGLQVEWLLVLLVPVGVPISQPIGLIHKVGRSECASLGRARRVAAPQSLLERADWLRGRRSADGRLLILRICTTRHRMCEQRDRRVTGWQPVFRRRATWHAHCQSEEGAQREQLPHLVRPAVGFSTGRLLDWCNMDSAGCQLEPEVASELQDWSEATPTPRVSGCDAP